MRYDFTEEDGITYGENRTLRIPNVVDDDGDPIVSFVGWTFSAFIVRSEFDAQGLTDLAATGGNLAKVDIVNQIAPVLLFPLTPTTLPKPPFVYWYEIWRTDTGNHRRMAHGNFPIMG